MPVKRNQNGFLLAPATGIFLSVLFFVFSLIPGVKTSPLWAILLISISFFLAFLLYIAVGSPKLYAMVPFQKSMKYDTAVTLVGVLVLIGTSILVKFGIFGDMEDYRIAVYGFSFAVPKTTGETVLLFFAVSLLPAILDELFFRGMIPYETEKGGILTASFMSALFYGFSGFSYENFIAFFLYGAVYAVILYVTKNILYTVLAHLLFGFYTVTLEKYAYVQTATPESKPIFLYLTFLFGILALAVFLFFAERKLRLFAEKEEVCPIVTVAEKKKMRADILTSVPFWIFTALFFGLSTLRLFL